MGLVSEKRVAEVRRETGRARSAGLASATGFGGVRAHLARRRVGCLLWAVPRGSVAVEHVVEIHVVEAPRAPVLRSRGCNIRATHGAICYWQPPRRVVVRARLAARGEGRRRSEGTLRTFARALVMSSARAETPLAMNAAGQARPPRPTDATRENFGRSSRRQKIPSGPLVGNRGICISHPTLPLSKRRSRDRSKPVRRAVSLSIPPRPGFTFRFNRARRRARPTFRPVDPPPSPATPSHARDASLRYVLEEPQVLVLLCHPANLPRRRILEQRLRRVEERSVRLQLFPRVIRHQRRRHPSRVPARVPT